TLFGFLLAALMLGSAAESLLRYGGSEELDLYSENTRQRGPFAADGAFALRYRSWDELYAENAADLAPWQDEVKRRDTRPAWLFVGNSFVHGAGMLVEHVRKAVPDRCIVTLHRTDPLPVRLAQVDLLQGREPRPE